MVGASKQEGRRAGQDSGLGPLVCPYCPLTLHLWGAGHSNDLRNNYYKAGFLFMKASVPSCNEFQMVGALGEGTGPSEDGLPPAE